MKEGKIRFKQIKLRKTKVSRIRRVKMNNNKEKVNRFEITGMVYWCHTNRNMARHKKYDINTTQIHD